MASGAPDVAALEVDWVAAYLLAQVEVHDPDTYATYLPLAHASIVAAGGRYIARGGHIEVLEGEMPRRAVIVEFPSRQAALEWYHGPAYTHARAIRQRASTGRLCIIDGVDEVPLE